MRLHGGEPSFEALGARVLEAVCGGDFQALQELALSREEFRNYVWPELPVSRPGTNISLDFVWKDIEFRSANHRRRLVNALKGRSLTLVRVQHRGDTTDYPTHRAFSDMEVTVRNEKGAEEEIPLFGSLILMDGVYKVYSYAPFD
jgi:hypothetical protein